jgi:hypothetical protein
MGQRFRTRGSTFLGRGLLSIALVCGLILGLAGLGRAAREGKAFLNDRQHDVELFHRSRAVNHKLRPEIFILMRLTRPQVRKLLTARGGKTEVQTRVGYAVQMHRLQTLSWRKRGLRNLFLRPAEQEDSP